MLAGGGGADTGARGDRAGGTGVGNLDHGNSCGCEAMALGVESIDRAAANRRRNAAQNLRGDGGGDGGSVDDDRGGGARYFTGGEYLNRGRAGSVCGGVREADQRSGSAEQVG